MRTTKQHIGRASALVDRGSVRPGHLSFWPSISTRNPNDANVHSAQRDRFRSRRACQCRRCLMAAPSIWRQQSAESLEQNDDEEEQVAWHGRKEAQIHRSVYVVGARLGAEHRSELFHPRDRTRPFKQAVAPPMAMPRSEPTIRACLMVCGWLGMKSIPQFFHDRSDHEKHKRRDQFKPHRTCGQTLFYVAFFADRFFRFVDATCAASPSAGPCDPEAISSTRRDGK